MDYFIFNLYFIATWILIFAGVIAIIIKLPPKPDTKNESEVLNIPRVSNSVCSCGNKADYEFNKKGYCQDCIEDSLKQTDC